MKRKRKSGEAKHKKKSITEVSQRLQNSKQIRKNFLWRMGGLDCSPSTILRHKRADRSLDLMVSRGGKQRVRRIVLEKTG